MSDRPGIFHDVCAICRDNEAQLLAAESSTTQQQNLYELEAIIEAEDELKAEWIRVSILAKFLEEMSFSEDGLPRLRLQKLQSLWHAKRDYEVQHRDPKGFSPQIVDINVKWIVKDNSSGRPQKKQSQRQKDSSKGSPEQKALRLLLPKNVRDILKARVRLGSEVHKHHDDGFYLRLSDTKNRFLRILFFKSNDPLIHVRVEYYDRPGATAEVTKALKGKGFNILSAYLGSSEARHRARLELLVRSESLAGKESEARKLALEQALTGAQASDLQLAISYPRDYAHSWGRKGIKLITTNRIQERGPEPEWFEKLRDLIMKHHSEFEQKSQRGLGPTDKVKKALSGQLVRMYGELSGSNLPQSEKIIYFMSLPRKSTAND